MAMYDEDQLDRVRQFARSVNAKMAGQAAPSSQTAPQVGQSSAAMLANAAGKPGPMVDVRALARQRLGRDGRDGGFRKDRPRLGGDGRPVRTHRQVNPIGLSGVLGRQGRPNSASVAVLG